MTRGNWLKIELHSDSSCQAGATCFISFILVPNKPFSHRPPLSFLNEVWLGKAETFHSSATTPEEPLHPLATDFITDWKKEKCLPPTGLPPLVRITPTNTAVRWHPCRWSDALGLLRYYETSLLCTPNQHFYGMTMATHVKKAKSSDFCCMWVNIFPQILSFLGGFHSSVCICHLSS